MRRQSHLRPPPLQAAPPPRVPKNPDAKQLERQAAREQKLAMRETERTQALIEKEEALRYARRYPVPDFKLPLEEPPQPPLGERPPALVPPALGSLAPSQTGSLLQARYHLCDGHLHRACVLSSTPSDPLPCTPLTSFSRGCERVCHPVC